MFLGSDKDDALCLYFGFGSNYPLGNRAYPYFWPAIDLGGVDPSCLVLSLGEKNLCLIIA